MNVLLTQYFVKLNIKHIFGNPYHSQSQSSVEVYNKKYSRLSHFCLRSINEEIWCK